MPRNRKRSAMIGNKVDARVRLTPAQEQTWLMLAVLLHYQKIMPSVYAINRLTGFGPYRTIVHLAALRRLGYLTIREVDGQPVYDLFVWPPVGLYKGAIV